MEGFDASSYGDAFADVYDDWYAHVSDVAATVQTLGMLAGHGPFLELGVGTGRIALALAATGASVTGIDSSSAMLDRLRSKMSVPISGSIEPILGDMIDDLPPGPFAGVYAAWNTFFSLTSAQAQQRLFSEVARRLEPTGVFVIEAAVPDPVRPAGSTIGVRSLTADKVVLSIDVHDPATQIVDGQFVEFSQEAGVRLRPWSIRYCTTNELDAMARVAGLVCRQRWENMRRETFAADSPSHVSVYAAVAADTSRSTPGS